MALRSEWRPWMLGLLTFVAAGTTALTGLSAYGQLRMGGAVDIPWWSQACALAGGPIALAALIMTSRAGLRTAFAINAVCTGIFAIIWVFVAVIATLPRP